MYQGIFGLLAWDPFNKSHGPTVYFNQSKFSCLTFSFPITEFVRAGRWTEKAPVRSQRPLGPPPPPSPLPHQLPSPWQQ